MTFFPPFGLSGGAMRFEPGSLALWINAERDDVYRQFELIHEIEQRCGLSPLFMESPANVVIDGGLGEMPEETKLFIARLAHESAHLRHHLATTYGYVHHVMNTWIARTLARGIDALIEKRTRVTFPLLPALGSEPEQEDYRGLRALQCIFDGDTGDELPYPPPAALGILDLILRLTAGHDPERPELRDPVVSPIPSNPRLLPFLRRDSPFVPRIGGQLFGARHILETLAFTREISLALVSGAINPAWTDMFGLDDYSLVLRFWKTIFEDSGHRLELLAALDLALCVPITPGGLYESDPPLQWHDIHPGWCFLQVCDLWKRQKHEWVEVPREVHETDKVMLELEMTAAKELGWPQPHEVLAPWIEFFRQATERGARGLHLELSGHPRLVGSLALAVRRLAQPYSIMQGYWDFRNVKVPWFPIAFTRGNDVEIRVNEHVWELSRDRLTEKTWSYFALHGARFFIEGGERMSHIPDHHFPGLLNALGAFTSGQVKGGRQHFRAAAEAYLAEMEIPLP